MTTQHMEDGKVAVSTLPILTQIEDLIQAQLDQGKTPRFAYLGKKQSELLVSELLPLQKKQTETEKSALKASLVALCIHIDGQLTLVPTENEDELRIE